MEDIQKDEVGKCCSTIHSSTKNTNACDKQEFIIKIKQVCTKLPLTNHAEEGGNECGIGDASEAVSAGAW